MTEPIQENVWKCPKCLSRFRNKEACDKHMAGCQQVLVWAVIGHLAVNSGCTMDTSRVGLWSGRLRMEMKGRKFLTAYDQGFSILEEEGFPDVQYSVVAYARRAEDVRQAGNAVLYGLRDALSRVSAKLEHGMGAAELERVVAQAEKEEEDEHN